MSARPRIRLGCEQLFDGEDLAHVRGRRVGLVTNHSGVEPEALSDTTRVPASV